jgi:thioredoxin reductase
MKLGIFAAELLPRRTTTQPLPSDQAIPPRSVQQEVALATGGNSAGQAAVFLWQYAAKVFILVRGPSLAASRSRYLIDRIDATPNIELRAHTARDERSRRVRGG